MADIFLLRDRRDREKARLLATALSKGEWKVRVSAAPDAELLSAECMIVLLSRRSVSSLPISTAVHKAKQRGALITVRLDSTALPPALRDSPSVDLSPWPVALDQSPNFRLLAQFIQSRDLRPVKTVEPSEPLQRESAANESLGIPAMLPAQPLAANERSLVSGTPSTLFLCYRRDDTQGEAGRLYDRLLDVYGAGRVFMDIDSVPLGIDFVDHVTQQISRCRVVIVMMGRQWLKAKDRNRRRRLDDPDDLVRAEIAAALRQKIPVIPVLVQDAIMPSAADLPDDIRLLARRNGIALRHEQWREGVERLLKELNPVMGRTT